MILFPPAKINLGLNVLRKREDSFHDIDTCMITIPLTDVLEVLPANNFSFRQTGLSISGSEEDNLVVKAYRLMQREYQVEPVSIHLLKNIPMGAGLGGGSSDAAYTILALNEIFSLQLPKEKLRELAAELGSDCPYFIENIPQIAKERGDILIPINLELKGYYIKLINPGIHIGTSEAYANIGLYKGEGSVEDILQHPISEWKLELQNSFENAVFTNYPQLANLKNALYEEGAVYASMTGSGSTLYGIFKNVPYSSEGPFFERILILE